MEEIITLKNRKVDNFKSIFSNNEYLILLTLFLGFFFLYHFLMINVITDFQAHIHMITRINNGEVFYPPHFMFFFLVNLFSGFSNDIWIMYYVASAILSAATVSKYFISKQFISSFITDKKSDFKKGILFFTTFALLFCFSISDFYNFFTLKYMYLSRVPSNVWHNSTLIALMPFALLLFMQQLKLSKLNNLKVYDKQILLTTGLIILNVSIKPSFLFVFFPISFLAVLRNLTKSNIKDSLVKIVPIFIGSLVLLVQYITIYYYTVGSFDGGKSAVVISLPFEFLRNFVPFWYIPIGLIMSYIFPIVTIVCYKEILKFRPFLYACAYSIVGFLISVFINEDGPRRFHGNFTWQNIICMYLLTLATVCFLIQKIWTREKYSNKMIFLCALFIFQFLTGILYLFKMYFTGHFS